MRVDDRDIRTVDWDDGALVLVDQIALPHAFRVLRIEDWREAARAISTMVVRGAGAIGAAGAYGLALACMRAPDRGFGAAVEEGRRGLAATRPTAQNLFAGLAAVQAAVDGAGGDSKPDAAREAALAAARAWADADAAACEAIGRHGRRLLEGCSGVSTHCNAGWLAFVDWGSALAPVYAATRQGQRLQVFVDETRPRGQGASLTSWELKNEGVEHAVIADNAFGWMAKRGEVQAVITGADRIARNGDVANKIGTFGHAAIARRVGIPFYVAFPAATVDADCKGGHAIPIEERGGDEVLYASGLDEADGRVRRVRVTPAGATARNPAFDVTDAELVDGLICEFGIFPATEAGVGRILAARDGLPGDSASERGRNPLAASIR